MGKSKDMMSVGIRENLDELSDWPAGENRDKWLESM